MGAEHLKAPIGNESPARVSGPPPPPPGFASLSSFFLKKVENLDGDDAELDTIDLKSLIKQSVGNRPWILLNQKNKDQSAKTHPPPLQPHKESVRLCPEDARRRDPLEEVPVFCPSEKEFKDALAYMESIRLKAEPYGMCRIIPPPSWKPPCFLKEKSIWEYSKFVTQIQRFDSFPAQSVEETKRAEPHQGASKRPRLRLNSEQGGGVSGGNFINPEEVGGLDTECNVSKPAPEFTLKTFNKHADDFMHKYFVSKTKDISHHGNCNHKEPSVETIESEYRRILENPTGAVEVLYGKLDTETFGSGFPTASNPWELHNYSGYVHSSWNLNNVPKLPGSLLPFGCDKASDVLVPQLRIGMCFSSQFWDVEDHYLYSLCYMHVGSPKIWHCVPGEYSFKFEAVMKKCMPDLPLKQLKLHQGVIRRLSPFLLKSEGVPVYRCIQHPGEFVLVFPGTYHSAFDCGFNVVEAANFAPLDWLPHGLNALIHYQEQGMKTSISFDKLLIGAAKEAVRAQWELSLLRKKTDDNLRWKRACGKDGGMLAKILKSRVKQEANRREYLCPTSQTKMMDENFNATGKRECSICFFDLYLSAAHCPCSADRYSCLNHAKWLCSCTWTEKIFLYRYDISQLNTLVEALEGKLPSVFKWAKENLNLALGRHVTTGKSCTEEKGQKEETFQDLGTFHGNGRSTASSIKEEIKARLQQSQHQNEQKPEKTKLTPSLPTKLTPSLPTVTQDDTNILIREIMPEVLSSSTSESSSSEYEEIAEIIRNHGGKGCNVSSISSSPPRREVRLSELLKDTSGKNGEVEQMRSTSRTKPRSQRASKKQKKEVNLN